MCWSEKLFGVVLTVFCCTSDFVYAQQYRNLVLEGAGIRGIAYAGALEGLAKRGALSGIERVGGTSAGAIAALMVALGYTPEEVKTTIYETKLQQFNDGRFFFVGGMVRMNRSYGWYRGKTFVKWLEKIIAEKTGNPDITFAQLHIAGFRDLYVTGTSLNNQRLMVFSREKYPSMKVKDAVRISMSIPFYFEAVRIDSTGRVLTRKDRSVHYDVMVDGGFTGNFPIFIFDSLTITGDMPERKCNPYTLGLRIDSDEQVTYDRERRGLAPMEINNFKNYIGAFYSYVIENLNRTPLMEEDWQRTISISSGGISPRIRRLSRDQKELLISTGRVAVEKFFGEE